MHAINPDAMYQSDCIQTAWDYVKYRIPQMTGRLHKKIGPKVLAWFFQAPIPFKRGLLVYKGQGRYIIRRLHRKAQYLKTLEF